MKEQHPVDDLFARNLRDAEVPPPPEVWQGIAQARYGRRGGWFRHWPWLVLLVVSGGLATYQLAVEDTPAGRLALHPAPDEPVAQPNLDEQLVQRSGNFVPPPDGKATPLNDKADEDGGTNRSSGLLAPITPGPEKVLANNLHQHRPGRIARDTALGTGSAGTKGTPHLVHSAEGPVDAPGQATAPVRFVFSPPPNLPSAGSRLSFEHTPGPVGFVNDRPVWMKNRWPVQPEPGQPGVQIGPSMAFADRPHAWWLAATVGLYGEHRTWKGDDEALVQALQGTEVLHPASSLGLLLGREGRGGWNMAIGLEYLASRFHFNHMDRFTSRQDSLVSFVITFNNQVLASYWDTLSTYSQVQQPVSAVNRVSSLRVPLELGWHSAYRRFLWGARAGLAVERNSIRSGATLANTVHGIRSEYPADLEERVTWLVDGSMALDLGYALSERWGLWASPTLSTGLLSLSQHEDRPFAMPGRAGLRLRLAYTLNSTHL